VDPIPLSAVNQFFYCPRRFGLMFLEGVFFDNAFTLEGLHAHEKVDTPGFRSGPDVRTERSLPLFCDRLGLSGKADIVEFHLHDGLEHPYPVEYKRGPNRRRDNDDAHVCAQALCLEEMFDTPVNSGAVYHVSSRHRRDLEITDGLRRLTENAVSEMHHLRENGDLPPAKLKPRCSGCSLRDYCLPEITEKPRRVASAIRDLYRIPDEV